MSFFMDSAISLSSKLLECVYIIIGLITITQALRIYWTKRIRPAMGRLYSGRPSVSCVLSATGCPPGSRELSSSL